MFWVSFFKWIQLSRFYFSLFVQPIIATFNPRISLDASDEQSGVHKIEYRLYVGNSTTPQRSGIVIGNMNNVSLIYAE